MNYREYSEEQAIINIPKMNGKTGNLWVSVNGIDIEIPRGIDVIVEKKYVEVIERCLRAEEKEVQSIESINAKERERIGAASAEEVLELSKKYDEKFKGLASVEEVKESFEQLGGEIVERAKNLLSSDEGVDVIKSVLLEMKRWKNFLAWDGVTGENGLVTRVDNEETSPVIRIALFDNLNHPSAVRVTVASSDGSKEIITLIGNEMEIEGIPVEFDTGRVTSMNQLGLYFVPQDFMESNNMRFEKSGCYIIDPQYTGGKYVEKIELGY